MRFVDDYGPLAGRILLSAIFIISGVSKLTTWNTTAAVMAAQGLPFVTLLLTVAVLIEIAGGLAILTGFNARAGAMLLFLYLIPVTLTFHAFWSAGAASALQTVMFLKNLAIMGGLLMVASFGPGKCSICTEEKWRLRSFMKDACFTPTESPK